MTVNARWRLTFRFADGDAYRVAIEDYLPYGVVRESELWQEYERIPAACSKRS